MEADAGPAFDFSHLPTDALHVVFEHVFAPNDPQQQPALPLSLFWERWAACSAVCKTWREVSTAQLCCTCSSVCSSQKGKCHAQPCWLVLTCSLVCSSAHSNLLPRSICCMAGAARAPAVLIPSRVGPAPRLAALAVGIAAARAVHPGGRGCGEIAFLWTGCELLQGHALQGG